MSRHREGVGERRGEREREGGSRRESRQRNRKKGGEGGEREEGRKKGKEEGRVREAETMHLEVEQAHSLWVLWVTRSFPEVQLLPRGRESYDAMPFSFSQSPWSFSTTGL